MTMTPFGVASGGFNRTAPMSAAKAAQLGRTVPTETAACAATPAVKALAASRGVELGTVTPSGVGGRITARDVLAAASTPIPALATSTPRLSQAAGSSLSSLYDLAWPGNEPALDGSDSYPVATGGN